MKHHPTRDRKPVAASTMRPLAAVGLLILATSCERQHHQAEISPPLPPIAAETRPILASEVAVFDEVMGTVVPRKQAEVAAKLTGRVLEMKAVPGMRVVADEVLARLDAGELDAVLQRADEALAQADRDLARYQTLRASKATTQAEFEQVESRQRIAAASVAETRSLIANATVTAPFDGTVTRKFQEPGDLAAPGRPLFALEDASLLRLEINVAQSLAGQIQIGDRFRVEVAGASIEGTVTEIAPSADVGSRTFSIKLDLPQNDSLRVGQFGRAYLPRGHRVALIVPETALISRGQMDYVFVADQGSARLRIVRSGETRDGGTEILAGLDDGESVVVAPAVELRDGQGLSAKP